MAIAKQTNIIPIGNAVESFAFDDSAAKSVIDKLLELRRSLNEAEQCFALPRISGLIEDLRSLIRLTPTEREEKVLYAIERQGAVTETEISEDTRLHRTVVNQLVKDLVAKEILYIVSRHVPGSDRPQIAIKSRRLKTPEVC